MYLAIRAFFLVLIFFFFLPISFDGRVIMLLSFSISIILHLHKLLCFWLYLRLGPTRILLLLRLALLSWSDIGYRVSFNCLMDNNGLMIHVLPLSNFQPFLSYEDVYCRPTFVSQYLQCLSHPLLSESILLIDSFI